MDTPNHPLSGASVLLAGATGGLGRALLDELMARGAETVGVALTPERVDAVAGCRATAAIDLRSEQGCAQAVALAKETMGTLDVVINAVGVVAFGPVDDLDVDTIEELFLTNAFVPIMLAKAAGSTLEPGGAFVTISGVIAEQNLPGMAAYGASKAAGRSFGEALAREYRRKKLRVLDARPPHTETGLADHPIAGTAPKMPAGLTPSAVARRICAGLEAGETALPSTAFG